MVQCFPSSDEAFVRIVRTYAKGLFGPDDLAERLRPQYPRVRVVAQRSLSTRFGEHQQFYVFRDGGLGGLSGSRFKVTR